MLSQLLQHAVRFLPVEACGIIGGKQGKPTTFYPTDNAEKSPVRYAVPVEQLFRVIRQLDCKGEDIFAIFHTHPESEAYPSPVDIQLAYYPEAYYLIMSLQQPQNPDLRAFTIRDGMVTEYPVIID